MEAKFDSAKGILRLQTMPLRDGYACFVEGDFSANPIDEIHLFPDWKDGRFFAVENHSASWCRPVWGEKLSELPNSDVQEMLLQTENGYECYLTACDAIFKSVIRCDNGSAEIKLHSNGCRQSVIPKQLAFLCLSGNDPFELCKRAAKKMSELLPTHPKLRKQRSVNPLFEHLGWCSWDAMQIRVNHEGLLEKAREFAEKKVPVGFAVIDDMWADVPRLNTVPADASFGAMVTEMYESKLNEFRGDPKRFPHGMQAAIADLKAAGIPKVGVWFPITGYWKGIDGGGTEAQLQKGHLTPNADGGYLTVIPEKKHTDAYFRSFCGRIAEWGGDFVKIDRQGIHTDYFGTYPMGQSAKATQTSIDECGEAYFGGAIINCMGMPTECLYNRPESAICRCSDDFIPESAKWFAKNVLQCSYNGLLQGMFYVNDWDMWWTDDAQAKKNSLCRAISGGPVYISDPIGRTVPELLKPLLLRDGRILRCDESATPTADCIMQNPTKTEKVFKIRNKIGGNGVIAVFNIHEEGNAVKGEVSPEDARLPRGTYVFREFFTGETGLVHEGETLPVRLENNDCVLLYSFVPYRSPVTFFGRTDLFMGVGIAETVCAESVTVKEGGTFGAFVTGGDGKVSFQTLRCEETTIRLDAFLRG